jgi:hypothetical protein
MRRTVRAGAHITLSDASRARTPIGRTSATCRMCGAQDLRYLIATGHRRLIECHACAFVFAAHPAASSRTAGHMHPNAALLAPVWQFLPEERRLQVLRLHEREPVARPLRRRGGVLEQQPGRPIGPVSRVSVAILLGRRRIEDRCEIVAAASIHARERSPSRDRAYRSDSPAPGSGVRSTDGRRVAAFRVAHWSGGRTRWDGARDPTLAGAG